ncbi:MAG TPA: hypothetical protein VMU48_16460 [Terracidiphilus sp.]|nr:hypothetical protein [Terracidiphilus sp.]
MTIRASRLHLYWVTTPDRDEDWFIVAKTRRSAERFHDGYEGYNPGDATAELVLRDIDIKTSEHEIAPFHAQADHLAALGAMTSEVTPGQRAVLLAGRLFVEGHMESVVAIANDNMSELAGHGRPRGTKRPKFLD